MGVDRGKEFVIYLDTHVVIWLYEGKLSRFRDEVYTLIDEEDLWISPMVSLELQYLFEVQKILKKPRIMLSYLAKTIALREGGDEFLDIVRVAELIGWTRDPFDRLIVAEAMLQDAPLVTADENIRKYYKQGVW